jgi:Protein kinase domain
MTEGATIEGYRVERVLSARIGIHTVVEAVGARGDRVAITLLDPAVADDPDLRRHVLGLARTRTSIRHPNVLPLVGPHEVDDRIGLVSALAGPRTLADRLEAGPLDSDEAVRVLCQVASALETAAEHGLVHRDLAPRSIVLDDERAFLGDFGITVPPLPRCELVDAAQGTDYCSPEEVRGEALTPESNVYSVGCILVECLTGAPPYPYDRPLLTMHAHVVESPPSVRARRPDLPPALDEVIARAMAKDPRERFRSPGRLMRAVAEALGVEATVPVRVPPRVPVAARARREAVPAPRSRRHDPPAAALPGRARFAALVVAAALAGLAAGLIDWSGGEAPPAAPQRAAVAERAERVAHVQAVGAAVERLAARRVALRRDLRDARRPAGQAAAARALANAYERARETLPATPASIPREASIRGALRDSESAYRRLASAARAGNRAAWRRARLSAERREARLARALRGPG